MKKLICVLIFALTSLLLVACNNENVDITETTGENIFSSLAYETSDEEQAVTAEKSVPYELKMDLNSYMRYLVNYFNEPYAIGDEIHGLDILTLVFHFCYSNRESLDFVKMDEATLDTSQRILIDGEGLRKTAKMLLGEDFEAEEHHEFLEYASEKYNAETDTYSVPTAKDYWGGDMYFIKSGSKLEITETDTSASVTAVVSSRALPAGKLEYKFEKIINNGFLFYRLIEVKRVEPPDDALEKASVESQTLTDHLVRFVLKEEAIDPYYTFAAEDVFRFIASLCVYRDDPTHPYGHMVKTDDTASYYTVSFADAKQIAYEVFGIEYFSPNDYPTELYNVEKESYYFPFGAGLWTSVFDYEEMIAFKRNDAIYVECHLVNSKVYEYPDADYGMYDFEFKYNDTDEPYITLKRIIAVG